MDPIQHLYMAIRQENLKIMEVNQKIQSNTGDVQLAYSTILSVHVSTAAGLTTTIHQHISTSLSQ